MTNDQSKRLTLGINAKQFNSVVSYFPDVHTDLEAFASPANYYYVHKITQNTFCIYKE